MSWRHGVWLAALVLPALALAQERDEDAMFGGGDEPAAPEARGDAGPSLLGPQAPAPASDGGTEPQSRDEAQLSGGPGKDLFETGGQTVDPLQIGGTLYLRYQADFHTGKVEEAGFGAPSLLDVYLDARPSDRVRGFVLGRLRYDPTLPATGAPSFLPGLGVQTGSNPSVALDQLWLRFDLVRQVYFTIGRQKVKWGVGRLWNPSDFLNVQRRDPLAPFDLRLGINAVKVHYPIESLGWNFYGYGLLDLNGPADTGFTVNRLGGALRAEILIGPAEVSLSGAWGRGQRPRYAIDASSPIGPVDVYLEVAFRSGRDFLQFREPGPGDPPIVTAADFPSYRLDGIQLPTTAGISYTANYTDANTVVVGVEYFYNPAGASKPLFHVPAVLAGTFTPFYAGVHYLGVFVLAPGLPNTPWVTLSLNNLVNISDPSGIVRADAFFRVMSFLQIEAFVAASYGLGEFRFGGPIVLPGRTLVLPYPLVSTGIGLRVSI